MEYSVALLRKAEKLALRYDPTDGFFLAFSGGKDSQCLYHITKIAGVKFKAHMSLTSIDPPEVVRFVKHQYPDVVRHAPKESIYTSAARHKSLPSRTVRWCCAEFKETAGAGKVTLIGIRATESYKRSLRTEVSTRTRKFSGDYGQFEQWQAKINEDEFSADKENEVRCISGKDSLLVAPILQWTDGDVWTFLKSMGIPHCKLYDEGFRRIGCILCPMSQAKQKRREIKLYPHVKRNWIKTIEKIKASKQGTLYSLPAEDIFEWWTSGELYDVWYSKKYYQQYLFDINKYNQ